MRRCVPLCFFKAWTDKIISDLLFGEDSTNVQPSFNFLYKYDLFIDIFEDIALVQQTVEVVEWYCMVFNWKEAQISPENSW